MIKKITLTLVALFILSCFGVYANKSYNEADVKAVIKDKRDKFYSQIKDKFNFSETDVNALRVKGYSPIFNFVMLSLAKKTHKPAVDLIAMRNDGLSWKEMCEKTGIDYAKFMAEVQNNMKSNKINFPAPTADEGKADAAPVLHAK